MEFRRNVIDSCTRNAVCHCLYVDWTDSAESERNSRVTGRKYVAGYSCFFLNYAGLVVALAALALGAIQKQQKTTEFEDGQPLKVSVLSYAWLLPVFTFMASGTNNTLINYLTMQYYRPEQTTLFMIIACSGAILIGTLVLLYKIVFGGEKLVLRSVIGGLILGVPNFLSLYFLLLALGSFGNSAAFVFPIYNILSMLVSSLAAWIFYKEKLNNLNRIGLALAVVAIILISYQELGL
jgi:multidrug transporter EmrE-like cation transporter